MQATEVFTEMLCHVDLKAFRNIESEQSSADDTRRRVTAGIRFTAKTLYG